VIGLLLVVGTGFILTSSIGLMRMPDFYTRMHGPTKASTLGLICVLLASLVYFTIEHQFLMVRELLVIVFLFLTAPVSAHMLSKAGRASGIKPHRDTQIEK
jgi:multicomponent K+:H+ antiporter subunit G